MSKSEHKPSLNTKYERDEAAEQLSRWYQKYKENINYATTESGIDVVNEDVSLTAGIYGPIVLRDTDFITRMQHFDRERIPERVVHAKGAGAFGYFECTNELSHLTVAKVFSSVGKKTPIAVRFSTVIGSEGAADTVRDPRGMALKFYTEEGNWDLVGNNSPLFSLRDPALFPSLIHAFKKNPVTLLQDYDSLWDFLSRTPESIHQTMFLFSDRGIPDGHRHMHGFGINTFSLIGNNNKLTWVKFHYRTDQGIKNLDPAVAKIIAGEDPDYARRDLYNAIEEGKKTGVFPSWTFYIQTMTPEQATRQSFNPFDVTKIWPHSLFPLQQVGKIVLNRNPSNFFADVEQLAFDVNNMPPGIGPSFDRILQGRMFSYHDTHLHRVGVNFQQLPVNRPLAEVANFQRDGPSVINNQGGAPNYHPNSFGGPEVNPLIKTWILPPEPVSGTVNRYDLGDIEDNYSQPRELWHNVLNDEEKERLVTALADSIRKAKPEIKDRAIEMFGKVEANFGARIKQKINALQAAKLKVLFENS